MAGSGTMTPISTGAPVGLSIAQPLPPTLLSLHHYAKIMGINPVHFFGAHAQTIFGYGDICNDIWFKYPWQSGDRVSLYDLALEIQNAERQVAELIGYWPAPKWVEEEFHKYPAPYRAEMYGIGLNARYQEKGITARFGKFISAGRRATTLIATADVTGGSLAYTDEDGDGFYETATVQVPTAYTDAKKVKVYFSGTDAHPSWEIRDPRTKTISGGFATLVFDSWLFIDPTLYEVYPNEDGITPIDISTVGNFVTEADVYYEYSDFSTASAQFYWETEPNCAICGGSGCLACELTAQDGCLTLRDFRNGILTATPATYNATDEAWAASTWTNGREPDSVRLWYYAGDTSDEFKAGRATMPMSNFLARAIAYLVTARLDRPFCSCTNLLTLQEWVRADLTMTDSGVRFIEPDGLTCRFGTRRGELYAWKWLRYFVKDKKVGFAVI